MFGLFFYYNAENKKIPQVIETCGTPTLLKAARGYSTAIFTLSLPILAIMIEPSWAENETLPFIDFAVPRALPSTPKKSIHSMLKEKLFM